VATFPLEILQRDLERKMSSGLVLNPSLDGENH